MFLPYRFDVRQEMTSRLAIFDIWVGDTGKAVVHGYGPGLFVEFPCSLDEILCLFSLQKDVFPNGNGRHAFVDFDLHVTDMPRAGTDDFVQPRAFPSHVMTDPRLRNSTIACRQQWLCPDPRYHEAPPRSARCRAPAHPGSGDPDTLHSRWACVSSALSRVGSTIFT